MQREKDTATARKGRTVALVIAGTMILWMLVQILGRGIGVEDRYVFLFDLAALAAFIWAFVNIYQLWRMRQAEKG